MGAASCSGGVSVQLWQRRFLAGKSCVDRRTAYSRMWRNGATPRAPFQLDGPLLRQLGYATNSAKVSRASVPAEEAALLDHEVTCPEDLEVSAAPPNAAVRPVPPSSAPKSAEKSRKRLLGTAGATGNNPLVNLPLAQPQQLG